MSDPPRHMSSEEFRRHGHAAVDWVASYLERLETFPVLSRAASSAQSVALEAVSWMTPPPAPRDVNAAGRPSAPASQSSTCVSSSVHAGLVTHSMPCTPSPAETSSASTAGGEALPEK